MTNENSSTLSNLDIYIGKRVREKRQKLHLTLMNVSEYLGISHQQVQKYEKAQSRICASHLYQISILFGVQPSYFFEGFEKYYDKSLRDINTLIFSNVSNSLNILLVEDDPGDELLTRKALESSSAKINVFCLHNGEQVRDFLRYKSVSCDFPRPDIILLDLSLPKEDGYDILRDIKRDRELQDIPVIILTNSINFQEMLNSYKSGSSGYICKSSDYEIFEKNIQGFVNYWSQTVILPKIEERFSSAFVDHSKSGMGFQQIHA